MACYHPIPAYQEAPGAQPRLGPPLGTANLALPCNKCIGCRSDRAIHWAHRCQHEAGQWWDNSFITLTYDDAHLPAEGHLDARALTLFIKRLRRKATRGASHIRRDRNSGIRYFACGEYGERNQRPHYHLLAFNCGFADRTKVGTDLYESDTLRELWPFGTARFGDATPAAAAYIAQYNLKKQGAGDHDADGVWRPAPFLRMSLKPAIGSSWLETYRADLAHGYLVENGRRHGIPRTYKEKLKQIDPHLHEEITIRTQEHRKRNPTDVTEARRIAGEIIHKRYKELTESRNL